MISREAAGLVSTQTASLLKTCQKSSIAIGTDWRQVLQREEDKLLGSKQITTGMSEAL